MPKFFITLSKVNSRLDFPDGYFFDQQPEKCVKLKKQKAIRSPVRPFAFYQRWLILHHATHTASVVVSTASRSFFWFVSNHTLSCQQKTCDRRSVFQCKA